MTVLEIMSWSFPGHERDEDGGGGGYKLLRSEYRRHQEHHPGTAEAWVRAIGRVLAYRQDPHWIPCRRTPEITVYDLMANGDIAEEDARLFGQVLARYARLLRLDRARVSAGWIQAARRPGESFTDLLCCLNIAPGDKEMAGMIWDELDRRGETEAFG